HGSLSQAAYLGRFFVRWIFTDRVSELRRRKALWKLTELWKNQKRVFPQLLEPSVHSFHNAGCCFLKHNFSSTPRASAARSRAHDDRDTAEVRGVAGDWVYQGEERDSPGTGV